MENAYIGRNAENIIQNTIIDQVEVVETLRQHFKIEGKLKNSAGGGIYGEKSDGRINFDCGHYIDMNIKSFTAAFNQLARTTIPKFCEDFHINEDDKTELQNLIIAKSQNRANMLFPMEVQEKWGEFFAENAKQLVKWGFSSKPSREILVLFNRKTNSVKIYAMRDILRKINLNVTFTKGGVNIGDCISFQRKGGNGVHSKEIPKNSLQHPGNNVQLKLKPLKFIEEFSQHLLSEYAIQTSE
ncbi:MAG: hypothetical protein FWG68_09450 [Defluviitaleaceae bacterium]|nr:hypothetical protein [Defluviitaleaceae bacterium]